MNNILVKPNDTLLKLNLNKRKSPLAVKTFLAHDVNLFLPRGRKKIY